MTQDVRRMIELRSGVRASHYRCHRELRHAVEGRLAIATPFAPPTWPPGGPARHATPGRSAAV